MTTKASIKKPRPSRAKKVPNYRVRGIRNGIMQLLAKTSTKVDYVYANISDLRPRPSQSVEAGLPGTDVYIDPAKVVARVGGKFEEFTNMRNLYAKNPKTKGMSPLAKSRPVQSVPPFDRIAFAVMGSRTGRVVTNEYRVLGVANGIVMLLHNSDQSYVYLSQLPEPMRGKIKVDTLIYLNATVPIGGQHVAYEAMSRMFWARAEAQPVYTALGERHLWKLPVERLVWQECRNGTKKAATVSLPYLIKECRPPFGSGQAIKWTWEYAGIQHTCNTVDVAKIECQRDWEERLLPFLRVTKSTPRPESRKYRILGAKHGVMRLQDVLSGFDAYVSSAEVFTEIYMIGKLAGQEVELDPRKVIGQNEPKKFSSAQRTYAGL